MNTGICGFGLILMPFLREYSMVRKIVRSGEAGDSGNDNRGEVSLGQKNKEESNADAEGTHEGSAAIGGHEDKLEV